MTSIERIFKTAEGDARLQSIINHYSPRVSYNQHFVSGLTFKEEKDDSPAFCLGFQMFNFPIGVIYVSKGLSSTLTQQELEFVVLHEMGHIIKNHFVSSSFIWLTKSFIVDTIADCFETTRMKATEYLEWLKAFYVLLTGKKTIEEEAKKNVELEADKFAVMVQGQKEHAISTLLKLSKGNIRAPTHVTFDGHFPFPVITFEERIAAVKRN